MRKKTTLLLCLLTMLFGGTARSQSCNAPVINSFSPNTGYIGSTVTISGSYFDPIAANNQVFFGATQASVVSATFSSLVVNVPAGATYAPISVRNSCGLIGISNTSFNGIFCGTLINSTSYNTVAYSRPVSGGYAMVSQDIDLDGKPELLVVGFTTNTLGVLRNLSTPGTFSFANPLNLNVPSNTRGVTPADFDGDGKVDLAVTVNGVGIYVYRNLSTPGNISFAAPVAYTGAFLNGGTNTYQIASGDLNNDGKIDIAFTAFNQYVYVMRNTSAGVGNISFQSPVVIDNQFSLTGLAIADIDNDGIKDIATAAAGNNTVSVVRNTTVLSSATLTFASPTFYNTNSSYPYRLFVGDFDKDGKTDLVANNHYGANTSVFRNTSSIGNISFAPVLNLPSPTSNYRIGVGDADGDGNPDLVTKSSGENVFSVYKNTSNGPGSISFAPRVDYPGQAEVSGIVIADLDGDFVPDISTSGTSYNTLRIHRNASSISDNTPPTALTKDIIVPLDPSGNVQITAAMVDNGSSDACGIGSLNLDKSTFTCADIGENEVVLTVTDVAGNIAANTAKVTVVSAAVIVAGQTTVCQGQTVSLSANQGDSYQWFKDGISIDGANSQVYTATETGNYSVAVTNGGGCSGTSAPTAITVNNNPTVTTYPTGNASICAGGSISITASESSVYQWYINNTLISGANQRTFNATTAGTYTVRVIDLFGCSAVSDPIIVNATDNIAPIAKAKDITVVLGANESVSITAADVDDGSNDNCGKVSLSLSQSTLGCEDVGKVIPVTLTVTDENNNVSTAISQVTVTDPNSYCNATPVAVGKEITVSTDDDCQGNAEANAFDGGSYDDDNDELTYSVEPQGPYALGITDVVLTVTDSKGASSTANTSIKVVDSTAPVIADATTITTIADAGTCGALIKIIPPQATDNCSVGTPIGTRSDNLNLSDAFPVGSTIITWSVTDANGNAATPVEQLVTVEDKEPPVILLVFAVVDVADAGLCGKYLSIAPPQATDNCAVGIPVGSRSDGLALNDMFPIGSTIITWNVTDVHGNVAKSVTQTMTIADEEIPVITTNGNKTVYTDAGTCGAATEVSATATDNCLVDTPVGVRSDGMALTDTYPVGTTTIKWNVTDANGNAATEVIQTVTVTDNELPVITSNGDKSVSNAAGTCGAAVTVSATATDNCSVGATVGVRSDGLALTDAFPVGVTTITWNVKDANGNAATAVTQTVTVNNETPAITSVSAPLDPVSVNTAINLTVAYTDNNVTNAAINWGDGSPVQNISNPTASFVTPHTYSAAGVYTVRVTLTDACSVSSDEYVYQYVVVYDPNGGFVTGGGWIDSPVGAYVADASLSGKASFGFVSKYKKGASVPDGQTQFQFHAAGFNFHSISYEWLVISGHKAQYKGEGTVNGTAGYGFLLSAVDGAKKSSTEPDRFRIKVWEKATGDVVYDNQMDAADDAEATTAISGGSIVIHEAMKSSSTKSVVTSGGLESEPLADSFYSYPVPFSDKTTIAFYLEKEEDYVLEVFDMKGALVRRLASGTAEANRVYEFELRSDGMAEGVYITRLTTTSSVRSLKAVLKR